MKNKRIIALTMAFALLLGAAGFTPGVRAEETPAAVPPVADVVITKVTGGDTLEVSLQVTAERFQTVGAVLGYDASKLRLIQWDGGKTPIPVDGAGWTAPAVAHTRGPDGLAGKPALACKDPVEGSTKAYLYLGADALAYTALSDELVVTVRLAYLSDEVPELTEQNLADYVWFAEDPDILAGSIPGADLVLTTGGDGLYVRGKEGFTAEILLTEGDGLGTGGGSGDYAVTFFDWDGTVLDAITVPKNAKTTVQDWKKKELEKENTPLKSKAGYDFSCWLRVYPVEGGGVEARNGTFPAAADAAAYGPDNADVERFTAALTDSIFLQAAYVENADCNTNVSDATNIYYTISDPVYTRYGDASADDGKYSVTYTVRRKNSGGAGVTRVEEPAVFVIMTPSASGAKDIVSKIDLDGKDETTFEVVPSKAIGKVEITLINTYGISSWPSSPARSGPTSVQNAVFVEQGSIGYIRDQAIETLKATDNDPNDTAHYPDAWKNYVDYRTIVTDGRLTGVSAGNLNAKKLNILTAMSALTDVQRRAVTKTDLQAMINGAYTPPTT